MSLNPADTRFADHLRSLLPADRIRAVEPRYLEDPRDIAHGRAGVVAVPKTTEEVAVLIRAAGEARVGVIPYGGGTGLVGGQVMPDGPAPMVLSLERMAAIRAVYPEENVLIAEAGAILADVQAAAREANRLFPLSLAAEGSCRIGGNLGTNAGGVNVLRYGNTRDLCLGLEAVLPDGSIWHGLTRLRKDNTGYDLKNLLIGAEGTLGVITAATLKLSPVPAGRGTALIAVASPRAALDMLALARDHLGEGVSAFELIHRQGLDFQAEVLPQIRQPWSEPPEWCVLIDVGLARGLDPQQALADLFEAAMERDLAYDGLIAQNEAQAQDFWTVREHLPEANRKIGAVSSHDISLPLGALPEFLATAPAEIARHGDFRINCFGHLGDGNLHYNIFPQKGRTRAEYANVKEAARQAIYDMVVGFGGSFSAEHGVGRAKVGELERYGDPARLAAMRAIKAALDPLGIMNPGAVLR
ncbi:FAD-binding oxidoreductase [Seohaeicola zhoushanensis]|uniref:D-2-hydroxyacid dehydrogenase n=1 Tax=Seohaeicola zhoushanensis TaxID=1569283 RepID=A0A8J3H1U2_9RHOB|nr:FAD-binding oxidoreductase [Seohaeicola zhoushanensis]GHF65823.1 D-2-hydroxyacid dehydrogenase [Seohaeicola zhoushanensis]